ncbi:MAG: type I methionyl aminopeptidase, partial [Propionibacterium sp.]
MRRAGLVVAEAHKVLSEAAVPGATTGDLDRLGREVLAKNGATSSFLNYGADWGYPPFPGVACISVNDEIVHGIPGQRVLEEGDIVSIDFGAIVDGWHGDAAVTCFVGKPSEEDAKLSEATRDALWAGIAAARVGGR